MKIGGFQKTSLLDFPDMVSCIVWTVGCNFRCPFCYNKSVVEGKVELIPEGEVFDFLEKRKGLLDGVVISGGEPFLQKDIAVFCDNVKKLGYLIKIDTNGMFPGMLKEFVDEKLVDYVAMDVKAPKKKYNQLAGVKVDISKIEESIDIIRNYAPGYEFKTTFAPGLLKKEDIVEVAKWLEGSKVFYLQQFKNNPPLVSSEFEEAKPYDKEYILETLEAIKPYFKNCFVRGI